LRGGGDEGKEAPIPPDKDRSKGRGCHLLIIF